MDLTEKTLESTVAYEGVIVTVQRDRAELPNGKTAVREVVRHPGGVAVLPLCSDGTVLLVRQYRYPFGEVLTEIPAGKLDKGEEPLHAAVRELREETGLTAGKLTSLGSVYASPGFCDEELHLYLAQDLHQGEAQPDEDEFLAPVRLPFQELAEQVLAGEVKDAKTVAAVLKAKLLLNW
ncbi:MAG: NUDIX hydrolase [Oscillospiraceae bacterium]|nr:NUDIX hydrolase [Oscillospiraceae bacterium]